MQDVFSILFDYHKVHPTTWMYLSSLLTVALYVKFSRIWSVRNFDLLMLILFAPGLLLEFTSAEPGLSAEVSTSREFAGYVWLFVVSGIFLLRLLADSTMVRRPLLEPNLSVGGMMFLGISLALFLMVNVINSKPAELDFSPTAAVETDPDAEPVSALRLEGPRHPVLQTLPNFVTQTAGQQNVSTGSSKDDPRARIDAVGIAVARTLVIFRTWPSWQV